MKRISFFPEFLMLYEVYWVIKWSVCKKSKHLCNVLKTCFVFQSIVFSMIHIHMNSSKENLFQDDPKWKKNWVWWSAFTVKKTVAFGFFSFFGGNFSPFFSPSPPHNMPFFKGPRKKVNWSIDVPREKICHNLLQKMKMNCIVIITLTHVS